MTRTQWVGLFDLPFIVSPSCGWAPVNLDRSTMYFKDQ